MLNYLERAILKNEKKSSENYTYVNAPRTVCRPEKDKKVVH